jgi:mono/diheme cytochrome c family protein
MLCGAACSSSMEPVAPGGLAVAARGDAATIAHGAQIAAIGNCAGCHTAPEGQPLAGGLPLDTPFGKIYSTNITPDPQTGIGNWSKPAFVRAMREGIARDGTHLYPAFPYDHFTKVADPDLDALYAYVMSRDPVHAENHANGLSFPFNIRPFVAVWNAMFLDSKPFMPDPQQSAEWNRGGYLVGSLGHCASCHTPRNALGAEKSDAAFDGSLVDTWYAPALNAKSPSPLPWSVEQLTAYLQTGIADGHAISGGPMQGVTHGLADADPQDVHAIATYIATAMLGSKAHDEAATAKTLQLAHAGPLSAQPLPSGSGTDGDGLKVGAQVYANTCAGCHDLGRGPSSNSALQMPLAIAVHDPEPNSLLNIIVGGIKPVVGEHGRWMPDFGGSLSDEQITALASYLRATAAPEAPAWANLAKTVKEVREP